MSRFNLSRNSLLGLFAFSIIIGSGVLVFKETSGQKGDRDVSSYTVMAESGTLPGLISASGELRAERSVNISPERQGLLAELFVDEGEKVSEGQLLAKMDKGDFQYRLNEVTAEYAKQKAAIQRRTDLLEEGAISFEEFDNFKNSFLAIEARLRQIEVEGEELMVYAPFSGVVTRRYAEPGAFVTPTTRASSVAGSTSSSILELSEGLEVIAKVSESAIGRILVGQKASVRVEAFPDERFQARVDEIAPRAIETDNVTSFEVTLVFEEPSSSLRIGMSADVEFQTGESAINTLVPTVAIVTENGKPGVLLVGERNEPKFQMVELGISNGSKTAILKGLEPGSQIFIDLPTWAKKKRD